MDNTILEVKNLSLYLKSKKEKRMILEDIHFHVCQGKCVGILGESGSGKSMTAKSILGLLGDEFKAQGEALFLGKDLLKLGTEKLRKIRGKEIAMVLQNPMTCFDPLYRIEYQLKETFRVHTDWDFQKIYEESYHVLEMMNIANPKEVLKKYPHQLSGGMLQRIMIGLALSLKPQLLIADEPTTALDAITQTMILEEFIKIKKEYATAMVFISHDLGAMAKIADHILVLNCGKVVDRGSYEEIIHASKDAYTKLLIEKRMAVMEKYVQAIGGEMVC